MELTYPNKTAYSTELQDLAIKYSYTYILQQKLMIKHNDEGKKILNEEITQSQFDTWCKDWYTPRFKKIIQDLLFLRNEIIKKISDFSVDLETI